MKPHPHSLFRPAHLATLASICITLTGHAASLTWDGNGSTSPNPNGGTGTWNVNATANWWNGATNVVWPALGGTDDDAVFDNTAGTVTLGSAITANDLTFNSTGYILTGAQTLILNGSTPTITTNTGVTATIGNNTALVISGSAGLTKAGAGTLILNGSAANTYTGTTAVNGGTLIAANASALGSNNGLSIANTATFAYRPSAAGALNLGSGVLNLAGGSRIGTALGGTASKSAITSSGAAVTTGTVTVDICGIPGVAPTAGSNNLITAASGLNGASYTLGNVFNATNFTVSGLTKTDTAVSITATSATALTNAYWKGGFSDAPGVWAVSNGSTTSNWASDVGGTATSLVPGAGATVRFSATSASNQGAMTLGANMSVAGIVVSDSAAVNLSADGYTLTLGTGGITVNSGAGKVTIGSAIALGVGNQLWTNNSVNDLTVSGNVATNGNYFLGGGGTGKTTLTGTLSGAGRVYTVGSATLKLGGVNTYTGETIVYENSTVEVTGLLGAGNYAGAITTYTPTSTFRYNNSATQTFTGQIQVTGTFEIAAGQVNLGKNDYNQFAATGGGTILIRDGGILNASHQWAHTMYGINVILQNGGKMSSSAGSVSPYGNYYFTSAGKSITGKGLGNEINAVLGLDGGITLTMATPEAGDTLLVSSQIGSGSGTNGGLAKTGAGTLTLSAANTYTGATTINGGKLTIGSAGAINSTSGVSIGAGEFNYNSTTALSKNVSFSGTGGTLSGTGTITPTVTLTSGNIQTAGSSITTANPSATVGKETFTTGITYNQGSIFEWNLTANTETSTGTRGINYDAINTGNLATSGSGAIFRVVLNDSQNFSESFWNTTRTWSDIFTNVDGSTNLDIVSIFGGGVEYWNSTSNLGTPSTQGSFTITGTTLTWTAVPEPSSALVGVMLGAGLFLRRRRGAGKG